MKIIMTMILSLTPFAGRCSQFNMVCACRKAAQTLQYFPDKIRVSQIEGWFYEQHFGSGFT